MCSAAAPQSSERLFANHYLSEELIDRDRKKMQRRVVMVNCVCRANPSAQRPLLCHPCNRIKSNTGSIASFAPQNLQTSIAPRLAMYSCA
jgi:hypothetical protein